MNGAITAAVAAAGLYAALNMLIIHWIASATGALRRKHKVSIGDGGVPHLIRIMRGMANAIENMPMFFVLLAIAALMGAPAIGIHLLGIVFTIGRALHAKHFIAEDAPGWQRGIGFGLSFLAQVVLALGIIGHWLWGMMG
ncbi:MAG TPA: MAPEG family protein [Rhizobiaceae bacterium]|nr:MAPEG family protein [Rhizobiaceae bacterium]